MMMPLMFRRPLPATGALVLAALVAAPLHAQQPPFPPQSLRPAVTVVGEAQVTVAPDTARIEAGVSNMARTAKAASESNNLAMGKVLLELKSAGIESKDIQTSQLSLQPQYASNRPGPSEITGYQASNIVTVKLRDVSKVASVIDALVGAGANEIRGISFLVSDASQRMDEARSQAIADAKRKAEIYAKAAGVSLGPAVSIAEQPNPNIVPMRRMAVNMPAAAQVAPGEETLSISVTVGFALKTP